MSLQVNNSGVTWGESFHSYPDSAFTKLLTLNVQRVFTITQKLVPMLEKAYQQENFVGRIINVNIESPRVISHSDKDMVDWIHQRSQCTWPRNLCLFSLQSCPPPVSNSHVYSEYVDENCKGSRGILLVVLALLSQ